jgi:hypothetical protein
VRPWERQKPRGTIDGQQGGRNVCDRLSSTCMKHTHVTVPTQFVEVNGIRFRFAYRKFEGETGAPLLFS